MKRRVLSAVLALLLSAGILFAVTPSASMTSMPDAYAQLLQEIRTGIEDKGLDSIQRYRPDDAVLETLSDAARTYFVCKWSDAGQGGSDLTQTLWALRDLDGNGVPELLLSASENNLDVLYAMKDGKIFVVSTYEYRGMGEIYGNTIRMHGSSGAAFYSSYYYTFNGSDTVRMDGWDSDTGRYTNGSGASITEAQAKAIDAKYQTGEQPNWCPLCGDGRFVDVVPGDWYYDNVAWAVEEGITVGTDRMIFSPEATCTRAQIVTFLWRAAGKPAPAAESASFRDVAADAYYCDAVSWAVQQGITKGTGPDLFSPDAGCTRAQVVTFLWRAAGSPKLEGANPFRDVGDGAYYFDAVLWAVKNSVTSGMSADSFAPDATCTRAQIAAFLYRCYGK